jgi:hypothetical protein
MCFHNFQWGSMYAKVGLAYRDEEHYVEDSVRVEILEL